VGRVEEVLVEKEARGEGQILGRTRRNKVVAFPGDPALIGRYTTVVLEETTGATFVGREVAREAGPERPSPERRGPAHPRTETEGVTAG